MFAGQLARYPEAGEPRSSSVIDKCIRWHDILMDDASPMGLAKRRGQADCSAQEAGQIIVLMLMLLNPPIEGFTTWILQNERRSPLNTSQRKRLSCPCRIEFSRKRVFALEPPEILRRRLFSHDR
jgi:hypothetical protein